MALLTFFNKKFNQIQCILQNSFKQSKKLSIIIYYFNIHYVQPGYYWNFPNIFMMP